MIDVNSSIDGVCDSVALLRNGDAIGFIPPAFVGKFLLKKIEARIVTETEARPVGISVGEKRDYIAVEFVVFTILAVGAVVSRLS